MFKKIELEDGCQVIVENNIDQQKTTMGVNNWELMFTSKQEVLDHIALLNKALEFWEFE